MEALILNFVEGVCVLWIEVFCGLKCMSEMKNY